MMTNDPVHEEIGLRVRHVGTLGGVVVTLLALTVTPGGFADGRYADCAEIYRHYMEDLSRTPMSAQRRAALHRWARRAYDACETGDLDDPKGLFEGLDRNRY